ncbi:hypothetical protein B0J12DRAFT_176231 [Macrophomina phaseolina]|uniref:Uncharacterized protein n=1 Tax=Macrophomina phaseolina TaxID=35725 RepID=A0ABQ8GT33_9PEZI|nr:hypothetical protein B0J12DRAFT_176231 [Macrophomina phaseolina]
MLGILFMISVVFVALQLAIPAGASFQRHYPRDPSSKASSALLNSTTIQSNGLGSLILEGLGATSFEDSSTSSTFASVSALNNTATPPVSTSGPSAARSSSSLSSAFPTLGANSSAASNGSLTNGSFGVLPSSGTGAEYATACVLEYQAWSSYVKPYTILTSSIDTTTQVLTNYTVSTSTSACESLGRPAVYMVGDPAPVATWTTTGTEREYYTTYAAGFVGTPPVCNVTENDCKNLFVDYRAAGDNSTLPYPGLIKGCVEKTEWTAECRVCRIFAEEVELIYFPQQKNTTIDICAPQSNSTVCPFGPTTAPFTSANPYDAANCAYGTNTTRGTVTAGPYTTSGPYTFFQGNAYLSFPVVSAMSTGCNKQVGNVYSNVMLTIASSDLYSYSGYHYYFGDAGYPFNFDDMQTVASKPWYQAIAGGNDCNYYEKDYSFLLYPNFVNGRQWGDKDNLCSLIYQSAYRPTLLLPPQIRSLDPAWSTCLLDLAGTFDPPIPLTPAMNLIPMPTSASGPASSKPPAVPASSPDSPDPISTANPAPVDPTQPADPTRPDGGQSPPQETGSPSDPTDPSDPSDPSDPGLGGLINAIVSQATNNNNNNPSPTDNVNDPPPAANNPPPASNDPNVAPVVPVPIATAGTQPIAADPNPANPGGVVIGTGTAAVPLAPGQSTVVGGGVPVVVVGGGGGGGGAGGTGGAVVVVGGSAAATVPVPVPAGTVGLGGGSGGAGAGAATVTVGGGVVIGEVGSTGGAAGGVVVGGSVTLAPGASTVLDGTPVEVGTGVVVVGGETVRLGGGSGDGGVTQPLFTVGGVVGSVVPGPTGAVVVVGEETVRPGQVVTVGGTVVSVGAGEGGNGGDVVVVGGSTVAVPQVTAAPGGVEAVFTDENGQVFTAKSLSDGRVVVGTNTLSADGPAVTLENGEVVSVATGTGDWSSEGLRPRGFRLVLRKPLRLQCSRPEGRRSLRPAWTEPCSSVGQA